MRFRYRLAIGAVVLGLLTGCALRPTGSGADEVSSSLSRETFIEEGDALALVVSTRPMRYRLGRDYVPLEFAILNKGLPGLSLTPESFTLVDGAGNRFAVATREELSRNYGNIDIDRNFADAAKFLRNKFSTYRRVRSNFSPGFDRPLAQDKILLTRLSFVYDFLYFPRPTVEGWARMPLELEISAPELEDPVFIRFQLADLSD